MPIRFRCPHCNQLMGIARRKSGSMVNCPTCNTAVLVPATDEVEESSPRPPTAPSPPPPARELFERDDFDALLGGQASGVAEPRNNAPGSVHAPGARPAAPEPAPAAKPPADLFNVERWNAPAPPAPPFPPPLASEPVGGVVLSPTKATILTVIVILLLAVAFGGGLIVGRFYL